jgi:sacsin
MYTVFDGSQDISVCSINLYKIIRKTEEQSTDLVPFSNERIQREGTGKDRIYTDIRRMLIAAWSLQRTDRRKVIKRLFLQWHPDKNLECPEMAKDITQFILDIIGKLERGEIGIDDYSAGYSTEQSHQYGSPSGEWYTFQDTVNRGENQRHNREQFSDTSYNDKPPNPQPAVALQWLRQSKYDCIAARRQLQTCVASLSSEDGGQQNSNAVQPWNWICYQCHQVILPHQN